MGWGRGGARCQPPTPGVGSPRRPSASSSHLCRQGPGHCGVRQAQARGAHRPAWAAKVGAAGLPGKEWGLPLHTQHQLRGPVAARGGQVPSWPSGPGPVSLTHPARNRIFKDARKDKGQDDFLGNVVLRLQVRGAGRGGREAGGGQRGRAGRGSRSASWGLPVPTRGREHLLTPPPPAARTCAAGRISGTVWSPAPRPTLTAVGATSSSSSFTSG